MSITINKNISAVLSESFIWGGEDPPGSAGVSTPSSALRGHLLWCSRDNRVPMFEQRFTTCEANASYYFF